MRPRERVLRLLPWVVAALAVVGSMWGMSEATRLRSENDTLRAALERAEAQARRACAPTAPLPTAPAAP